MDKYQKLLVQKARLNDWVYFENKDIPDEEHFKYWNNKVLLNLEEDSIIIAQNENPNIVDYILIILKEKIVDSLAVYKNSKWHNIKSDIFRNKVPVFRVNINFNERVEKIKIGFRDNLADDYILDVKYQEADKEKHNEKLATERKAELLKDANIKVSTGADLVNIYFQPCCDSYSRTEIALYKDNMMLAKYKVDEETFFKSISGLAYGKYEFILKQFDDKGNIILEMDKISFSISRPTHTGMNVVDVI